MKYLPGMSRKDGYYTSRLSDGSAIVIREEWTVEDALEGVVREWLTPTSAADVDGSPLEELTPEQQRAARVTRVIRDEHGNRIALLVDPEIFDEGEKALSQINADAYGEQGQQYRPFVHAPNATTDRLINTEVLERMIIRVLERHGVEITDEIRKQAGYDALVGAITFSFDPDSRGLMPVMTPGRPMDGEASEWYWSLLYPSPVAGIFIRARDDVLGSTAYSLTSGSGWTIMSGFYEREYAEELAVKLASAAPGLDWFQVSIHSLTAELKATFTAIAREHGTWRKEDRS